MFNWLDQLMQSQTLSGQVICWIILAVGVVYVAFTVFVRGYFSSISRDVRKLRSGKITGADTGFMRKAMKVYSDAVRKGVRDVGDTAILEESISPFINFCEYILHYLPSLATILGLMGTFFGLTAALGKMDLNMDSINQVEEIINNINAPIADMSTAFYTSLVGIITSALMNMLERVTRTNMLSNSALQTARDYINIEYLNAVMGAMTPQEKYQITENEPASIAWTEASRRIAKALQSLKESLDKMTEDINSLEQRGILSLSNNITSLIRTYQVEHDDVSSVNESMKNYLTMLTNLGRSMERNDRVMSANESLLEQMAVTYRMLAEEHKFYENAIDAQADSEVLKLIKEQLNTLITRLESALTTRY